MPGQVVITCSRFPIYTCKCTSGTLQGWIWSRKMPSGKWDKCLLAPIAPPPKTAPSQGCICCLQNPYLGSLSLNTGIVRMQSHSWSFKWWKLGKSYVLPTHPSPKTTTTLGLICYFEFYQATVSCSIQTGILWPEQFKPWCPILQFGGDSTYLNRYHVC